MSTFGRPASLFVGNLAQDVNENTLYESFSVAGKLLSTRVCRDAISGRSLGYAYVNYTNVADAEKALDVLNYSPIRGRPCHIMWSQRDPSLRRSGVGNIFVKGLDPSIDSKKLHDEFSRFGDILSCRVMTDDKNVSKGYGFVHFENETDAFEKLRQKSVRVIRPSTLSTAASTSPSTTTASTTPVNPSVEASKNDKSFLLIILINDKEVTVSRHIPPKERSAYREQKRKEFTNLYVKNFNADITDEQFKSKFAEFGTITSGIVMRDSEQKSRGFGFVNFKTHEEAQRALDAFQKSADKDKWYVARHQSKLERNRERLEQKKRDRAIRSQGVNLYVKNIGDQYDEESLHKDFSAFGKITSLKIQKDSEGKSRGFGYVCFSTPEEANRAIHGMHRKPINDKLLYVSHFQSKEERRIYLDGRYYQNQMRMNSGYPMNPYYYGQMPHRQRYPPNMPYKYPNAPVQNTQRTNRPNRPVRQMNAGAPNQIRDVNPRQNSNQVQNKQYKYTHNAKNVNSAVDSQVQQQQQQQQQAQEASYILTPEQIREALHHSPKETHKQLLGDQLYYQIFAIAPHEAPKITGMLMEMEITELLLLIESPVNLNAKVNEAVSLLKEKK